MQGIFLKLLDMSLAASVVILAVLAARLLLRRAPKKWSYLLWSAVGFRLACPVSLESVFSIFRAVPVKPAVTAVSPVGQAPASTIQYVPRTLPAAPVQPVTHTAPALPAAPAVTAPAVSTATADIVLVTAIAVWLLGMGVLLLYAVVRCGELRLSLVGAVRLEGNVYQADGLRSPFILGLFRPKIYIPYGLEGETLDYVLAHERYHIRRGDHMVKTLAYLLLCIHWFNPLVWLGFHLMGRDMEMSCDEKVLGERGNIRKAYSATLLSFATERRFPAAVPLAFGETAVTARIKNALGWKKPKTWMTLLAALACVALVVSCAVNPAGETADNPDPSETAAPATAGAYTGVREYVERRVANLETVTYNSWSGLLSSSSEAEREPTATVIGTRIDRLEKRGELEGLSPDGVLECWEYNYLLQIDADPDDVMLAGGMYEEDGWFDLEGQGGHGVVALRYADGSCDILEDWPINDGVKFYGSHDTVEEALYDWYAERYEPAPAEPAEPVFAPKTLEELLATVTAEDIGYISGYGVANEPAAEELAPLLNEAAGHTVEHDALTVNGSDTDVVWDMDFYIAPKDQGGYSGDDAVYLFAGVEEDLVEIFAGANLPDGRIFVKDKALYQLIRTLYDSPDRVDQAAYEKYKEVVDAAYDGRLATYQELWPQISAWELTYFQLAGERSDLGIAVYQMDAAMTATPREAIIHTGAGGAYIDGRLRLRGIDWQLVYLAVVDGEPVGAFYYGGDGYVLDLNAFATRQEFLEQVERSKLNQDLSTTGTG